MLSKLEFNVGVRDWYLDVLSGLESNICKVSKKRSDLKGKINHMYFCIAILSIKLLGKALKVRKVTFLY